MQTPDEELESRTDCTWFHSPSDLFDACVICCNSIIPGEIIAETENERFLHLDCWEAEKENVN